MQQPTIIKTLCRCIKCSTRLQDVNTCKLRILQSTMAVRADPQAVQAYRTTAVAVLYIQILAYINAGPVKRLSKKAQ
jgi:hypothetical protein